MDITETTGPFAMGAEQQGAVQAIMAPGRRKEVMAVINSVQSPQGQETFFFFTFNGQANQYIFSLF
jgi:hypothetical protein